MLSIEQHWHYNRQYKEEELKLKLKGMEGAAMDYAVHGHAVAHISLGSSDIECKVLYRHPNEDALLLDLPQQQHLPRLPKQPVYVHFEINHGYFKGLHKAVDYLSEYAVSKLFPERNFLKKVTTGKSLTPRERSALKEFTLDNEYQMNALQRMVSSDPRVPLLVIGPFGTGKTRILAAAVSALLTDPNSHILVCTYQHQCANTIYQLLFKKHRHKIMRLVPNKGVADGVLNEIAHLLPATGSVNGLTCKQAGVMYAREVKFQDIQQKQVIVNTFLTATNLKDIETQHNKLHFTHILIDEGAQAREPESLGALAVVKEDTRIVIVGDHKQVSHQKVIKYWMSI